MPTRVVDDLILPITVAGHPALELVNTRAGWAEQRPKEYLQSYAHLVTLAGSLGLVEPDRVAGLRGRAELEPRPATTVLRSTLRFRTDLYKALTLGAETAVAGVDRTLRGTAGRRRLDGVTSGAAEWSFGETGLELPMLAFAWSAYGLLDSGLGRQVDACPGPGCGWLFLDRTGRRRWCSMRWCGNRSKARRHAERART